MDISSSLYLSKICGIEGSPAPFFDLDEEYRLQEIITVFIQKGLLQSAHDVSEGGLFTTLAESGFHRGLGFDVNTADKDIRKDAFWFGESQSRVVVSVSEDQGNDFIRECETLEAIFVPLGKVTSSGVRIDGEEWGGIKHWKQLYNEAIEKHLQKELSEEALNAI